MRRVFVSILSVFIILIPVLALAADVEPQVPLSVDANSGATLNLKSSDVDYFAADLYCVVRGFIRGSLGTAIGLLISLIGGYTYLMKKSGYGLFFFFAGVALTALPGIFGWYYKGVVTAVGTNQGVNVLGGGYVPADKVTLEDWCKSPNYSEPNRDGKKIAIDLKKDVDPHAERGLGLRSLLDGTTSDSYSCNKAINYSVDNVGVVTITDGVEHCSK